MKLVPKHPHSLEQQQLLTQLETDIDKGLSGAEAASRLQHFGPNQITQKSTISPWSILLAQFQDTLVIILLLATVIAGFAWYVEGAHGFPTDAVVILAIVVANAVLGFSQEFRAEKTLEALTQASEVEAKVIRDGALKNLSHEGLVPGDIVVLAEGDRVPADAILLEATHLAADESPLTGESVPVNKSVGKLDEEITVSDRTNAVYSGTHVTAGEAKAVVVQTGSASQLGQIATSLSTTTAEPTPLQRRLDYLGKQIGWIVAVLSILIGATVLWAEGKTDGETLLKVAMFAVALAVAAVPEGLPAVLTISLSEGAKRLAAIRALARKMAAVETLGSVTTIMTDKTGTLTCNQMTVKAIKVKTAQQEIKGTGYSSTDKFEPSEQAIKNLILCGLLAGGGDLEEQDGQRQAVGDPMDAALLVLAEKAGLDWRDERDQRQQLSQAPFSSDRARVSLLWSHQDRCTLYSKGSLERILEHCSYELNEAGERVDLSDELRQQMQQAEQEFGQRGWRTLALAERPVKQAGEAVELEQEMTLLGVAAFADPPRDDVPLAIQRAQEAGIRVIMVTGDHPQTAAAIAREVGMADLPKIVSGAELAKLDESELKQRLDTDVFARVTPAQKLRLAEAMIESGEVVAMTGDGVNDAPALKKVHVGLAMGRSGTAVAVEASDIVLMDDDFSTIVAAIREGRSIFANVQRFIAFLFSGNLGVVIAMFLGAVVAGLLDLRYDGELLLPLLAAQILWMNLVTDGAPAVAFALGPSDSTTLKQKPRDPAAPILDGRIWSLLIVTGLTLAVLFLTVLDLLYSDGFVTWAGLGSGPFTSSGSGLLRLGDGQVAQRHELSASRSEHLSL